MTPAEELELYANMERHARARRDELVRLLRADGWSWGALAKAAGMSRNAVAHIAARRDTPNEACP